LAKGFLFSLACLALCVSCSEGSTSAKKAAKPQGCEIKTNEVTENSITNLPNITDFGGSTFVACKTGVVTTLSFKVAAESEAQPNAMVFFENGIGNGVIENGSKTYAEYFQTISIPAKGHAVIKLDTPFPVEKGETYTWYVQKDPDAGMLTQAIGMDPSNGYEGGSSWYNNKYYRGSDNIFSLSIR